MFKKILVALTLLIFLLASAGVVNAAVPTNSLSVGKTSSGGDDVQSLGTITLGTTVHPVWTWTRNGAPLRYASIKLQESYNSGSWTTRATQTSDYYGRVSWYIKPLKTGNFRYRTVYGSIAGTSILYLTVVSKSTASFSTSPTVGSKSTNFKFMGSASGGTPTSWYWTFGDGKSAYGKTVYHKYASTGYKSPKLTVKFSNGITAWQIRYNYIRVT
jgi:PKD repeat protein